MWLLKTVILQWFCPSGCFHISCPLLPLCTTYFRTGKKLDVPYLVYMFNISCSYPNPVQIRYYFMDEHAHSVYAPYLNQYVTYQLDSMAQGAAVAQCHLGTLLLSVGEPQSAKRYMLDKKRITKFRGPWWDPSLLHVSIFPLNHFFVVSFKHSYLTGL